MSNSITDSAFPSPYQSVMSELRGQKKSGTKTPFTVYDGILPRCRRERILRNRGLGMVYRKASYRIEYPNVRIYRTVEANEKGHNDVRIVYETPYGNLTGAAEDVGYTTWTHAYPFKGKDDYKALDFIFRDAVVVPDYPAVASLQKTLGDDFVIRDQISLEPIQSLISTYMGTETFCLEWMDNRDMVLEIYRSLVELARKVYPVVADSPLEFANYGGNVTPSVIGLDIFVKYYCPNYEEAAEILHKTGTLIGSHLDADNTVIMDAVAKTPLDYIEAYDPGVGPPLSEAIKKWPDKAIWINYPCAWHLESPERIFELTKGLIRDARESKGFVIGITDDVPPDRLFDNYEAIMDAIYDA